MEPEITAWFPDPNTLRAERPVIVVYERKNGHYHLGIDTDARLWQYVNMAWRRIEGIGDWQRELGRSLWGETGIEPENPDQC